MQKHRPTIQKNERMTKSFTNTTMTSFKTMKNLSDLLDGNTIVNGIVKNQPTMSKSERCTPCYSRKTSCVANK